MSLSSTEGEYVVVLEAAKTIVWLGNVLNELSVYQQSTCVHLNNTGYIEWAAGETGKNVKKRNLIDVRHNHKMQVVEDGFIYLSNTDGVPESTFLTEHLLPGEWTVNFSGGNT